VVVTGTSDSLQYVPDNSLRCRNAVAIGGRQSLAVKAQLTHSIKDRAFSEFGVGAVELATSREPANPTLTIVQRLGLHLLE
jgi:hypothetical protein